MLEDLSSKRKEWIMRSLRGKLAARGGNLGSCLRRAFKKFDRNESGELDMEEFRLAMEEYLPGIDEAEFQAVARDFDADGDGVVSIAEFVAALSRSTEVDARPGSHANGLDKRQARRRPIAGGVEQRRGAEFFDDGYNLAKDPAEEDPAINDCVDGLRHALRDLCAGLSERGADVRLLRRAFERHRPTPAARHLALGQFQAALLPFFGDDDRQYKKRALDRLWKKCDGGDYEHFIARFYERKTPSSAPPPPTPQRLTKAERATLRLKHELLDKIDQHAGASFRVKVKRMLDKYDLDNSGELEREECERAFLDLLHGHTLADIRALVADFDADANNALSVDEIATSLVQCQRGRAPGTTTLSLNKKHPLWTKQGARGLS
ncbi:hypothetical protein CTAYLR_004687 [Chrysophaeum taylorii]|uniref:EF-hand domain-containing protein n=1 Tax=Chrysophaeum taylorii TaxID=2483200 RepID=A0AAD7U9G8_9STRA|nr:hypothetical protein CTAYLR_004687 [Chrysophaeum taylorii]